jgi:hypothetical protein
MTISIRFTYSTPDYESGDSATAGYCDQYGEVISENSETDPSTIQDFEIEQWNEPGDLAFLIDKAIALGICEPSNSPFTLVNANRTWWSSVDGETQYCLHIKGLTDTQMFMVNNILKAGYLSSDDQDYLDSIDGQLSIA